MIDHPITNNWTALGFFVERDIGIIETEAYLCRLAPKTIALMKFNPTKNKLIVRQGKPEIDNLKETNSWDNPKYNNLLKTTWTLALLHGATIHGNTPRD